MSKTVKWSFVQFVRDRDPTMKNDQDKSHPTIKKIAQILLILRGLSSKFLNKLAFKHYRAWCMN